MADSGFVTIIATRTTAFSAARPKRSKLYAATSGLITKGETT